MPALRLPPLLVLAVGCCLLLAGCSSAPRDVSALHPAQAEVARSLEARAADRYWSGDPATAMELYQKALTLWHGLDDVDGIIRCRTDILGLMRETSDAAERAEWLQQTRTIWAAYQTAPHARPSPDLWRSQVLLNHSVLLWALEARPVDLSAAENALRDTRSGIARLPSAEQRDWQLSLRNLEARLRLAQGDPATAARLLQAGFPTYANLGEDRQAVCEVAQGWYLSAGLAQHQSRWAEAATRYQSALEGFRLVGQVRWMQACLENLVEVCQRNGRDDLAQQYRLRLEAQRRSLEPATGGSTGK